jgi:predicted phage terminase large subunit-like protein
LAASTKSDSPWTAGVKVGKTPAGRYIIAGVVRERVTTPRQLIRNTAAHDSAEVFISYPQDPGQAGKDQAQSIAQDLAGYRFKSSPESGDKATRAEPFAAQCEAGNVDIIKADWNAAFLDEICAFPFGQFMDQVDATSRAFNELAAPKPSTKTSTVGGLF